MFLVAGGLPGDFGSLMPARRHCAWVGVAATLLLFAGAGAVHDATASNDTRTLSFHHTHSGEDLTITFKRNGRYDEAALKTLNHYLRDWRTQQQTTMDPHLFDILWEVYRDVDAKQPINIISSYRSPSTNAMLRRRSAHSGVARFSQHMLGRAMDFFIPGVPLEQIRFAGLRLQRGGVGFYPTSGSPFVHLDTGNIRHWPRMTHDQLARVFPNGKTVHIPSDGVPLRGYQVALAEIHNRKSDDTAGARPGVLATLFKGTRSTEDDESVASGNSRAEQPKPDVIADARQLEDKAAEIVPLPRARPLRTENVRVASAAPVAAPRQSADHPQSMTDIINARVAWDDSAATPTPATAEQVAAVQARRAANDDPETTSALPPNVANAMAYALPRDFQHGKVVTASAPLPPSHFGALARNPLVKTIVGKALHREPDSTTVRIASARHVSPLWTRAMILAADANRSLQASHLGDQDMAAMSVHFVKPARAVTMTFSNDPQMGIVCDRFTGRALTALSTTSFAQTASLP